MKHGSARATADWLAARGLYAPPGESWRVTIGLDDDARSPKSYLRIAVDSNEWGFRFVRENQLSSISVGEAPRVDERDDFGLVGATPSLRNLASLIQRLETRFDIRFRRAHASIRSSLPDAGDRVRLWVVAAL